MDININEFMTTKLVNMCKWLKDDKILSEEHPFFKILSSYTLDFDSFAKSIKLISSYADTNNDIPDETLNKYAKLYSFDIKKFSVDQIHKFKRYINTFITCVKK